MEEAQKILKGANDLFMRIGIKSVSMDDIAREIGVSKKTIYKHYADKKTLVNKVIETDIKQDIIACEACYAADENAVQKMISISRHVSHTHKDTNPTVIFDLQKYYPEEWNLMEKFQTDFIKGAIAENVNEGKNAGLYREELDPEVAALIYSTLIKGMMMQLADRENNYDFKTLHLQMVSYHLNGICTEKGRQYLTNHVNDIITDKQ